MFPKPWARAPSPSQLCPLSGNLEGERLINKFLNLQILAPCPLLLEKKKLPGKHLLVQLKPLYGC